MCSVFMEIAVKSPKIAKIKMVLEELYPEERNGCRCYLFKNGLRDGLITPEEYGEARTYYGKLWDYTGD